MVFHDIHCIQLYSPILQNGGRATRANFVRHSLGILATFEAFGDPASFEALGRRGRASHHSMIFYDVSWYSMVFHDIPWHSTIFYGIPWYFMIFHDSPSYSIAFRYIPLHSRIFHDTTWHSTMFHVIVYAEPSILRPHFDLLKLELRSPLWPPSWDMIYPIICIPFGSYLKPRGDRIWGNCFASPLGVQTVKQKMDQVF